LKIKEKIFGIKGKIDSFFNQVVYVLRASKKPSEGEVMEYLKVVLVGILLLGLVGFAISLIFKLVSL
jgi:protein translocase SEC61 complex gamma subunit